MKIKIIKKDYFEYVKTLNDDEFREAMRKYYNKCHYKLSLYYRDFDEYYAYAKNTFR